METYPTIMIQYNTKFEIFSFPRAKFSVLYFWNSGNDLANKPSAGLSVATSIIFQLFITLSTGIKLIY